jgi:glycosyltransferase involved in cell wall biosynthesis
MSRKKKFLYHSDFALAKTGFGRVSKSLLTYLYKTGKYDIVHYCCGMQEGNPDLLKTPWKSLGALPNSPAEIEQLNKDPNQARMASYGSYYIDKVIEQEKPDVYIAAQDIWGVDYSISKPWFKKIKSSIWTTLDSLPILPTAVACAPKLKHYWIWSDFATKALHEIGHKHIDTMHGPIDVNSFYKLSQDERRDLRIKNNISPNAFIIGFVFRNQLRKSVPNLLEGYALWKARNPEVKNTYLLLHTHWSEGWNIYKLADEYGIPKSEILTTYVCKVCGNYEIKNFTGQELDCKFCGAQKAQITTNVGLGVSEAQLNEVYNLMDVYCHPFTSGGQEIPIQEAKLTELITLVTNYSCGEEMCYEEANSLALDWSEYREHGTEFRKASTIPSSIAKQLQKVWKMPIQKRIEMGKAAREWTINNYSSEVIGKKFEDFIDSAEYIDYKNFSIQAEDQDPLFNVPKIDNDSEWLKCLYANILKRPDVDENDDGHKYWMQELGKGKKREEIENYFRQVAWQENQKNKKVNFEDLLDKNDKGKRILYVIPQEESDVFLSTSLFPSIKNLYPNHNLYVATKNEFFEILDGNPNVHKVIPFVPQMENQIWCEGNKDHEGYFDIAFLPYVGTQKILTYLHNAKDKIEFDIKNF